MRVVQIANEARGDRGAEQQFSLQEEEGRDAMSSRMQIQIEHAATRGQVTLRCRSAWRAAFDFPDFFFPGMIRDVVDAGRVEVDGV